MTSLLRTRRSRADHQLPPAAPVVVSLLGHAVCRLARRRGRPPDSALYAESADAAEVLSYMTAHS